MVLLVSHCHKIHIDFCCGGSPESSSAKNTAKIRPILQVIVRHLIELGTILSAPTWRIAVARQIHQPPGPVHREHVDELGMSRGGETRASSTLPESMFSSEDLPTLDRPMKGEFRQRLVRTRNPGPARCD